MIDRPKHLTPGWRGGVAYQDYKCAQCRKRFNRKRADVWGKRTFCSYSCRSIYTVTHNRTSGTDIERAMEKILTDRGLRFVHQCPFKGIGVADFFLPHFRLAIFCDGEYWHNYPNGKPRDSEQVVKLQAIGIRTARFWGKDILNNTLDLDAWLSKPEGNATGAIETAHRLLPSKE